jgi:phage terminase large subunit-like protein
MPIPPSDPRPVRAAAVIKFIETMCVIPSGSHAGQPFKLTRFQRRFITDLYDNPAGSRRGFLSTGRKSGKTLLLAALMLCHLCGPAAKARPNSQLYSCAQSRDQAGLIFDAAVKMVRLNSVLSAAVRVQETAKTLSCPDLGVTYKALSSETSTAFGLNPQLTIFDEVGQIRGPRDRLVEALETATAGIDAPLSLYISTQAASDDDLFSILLDDALAGNDPRTIVHLYTADPAMDPFCEEAIRGANPGFDDFMNKREVLDMAAAAKRMSGREAEYRNLILNQRVDVAEGSQFVTRETWLANNLKPREMQFCRVYGGLDMSSVGDVTVLVLAGLDPFEGGDWSVKVHAWLPRRGLDERAAGDRELYRKWVDEGLLELVPGGSIDPAFIAKRVVEIIAEYPNFQRVAYDRWGMDPFLRALEDVMSADAISKKFVAHGQGFRDMTASIAALERVLLDGKLRHGGNLVLNSHIANTVIVNDDAGNRKFSKKRARGRIDSIVALAMAIGCSSQKGPPSIDVSALIG